MPIAAAILTVSDTRTPETDRSGDLACDMLEDAGHTVIFRELIPDDEQAIGDLVARVIDNAAVRLLVTVGGTGVGRRDVTVPTVRRFISHPLEGFGEYFRAISREQVGPMAMLSNAAAGIVARPDGEDLLIAMLPGSPKAVGLGVDSVLLPILDHVLELRT